MRRLLLFSSDIERDAAFPDGVPADLWSDITGVGLVDAGIATARIIANSPPDEILFLGTCGAHRESGLVAGDICVGREVSIDSGDVASGAMRVPSLLPSRLRCAPKLSASVLGTLMAKGIDAKGGDVSCTFGITESDELASTLRWHSGASVENLEAFSVVRAAGEIPVALLLGVTNIVGKGGGTGWIANYRRMMRILSEAVV